MAPVAPVKTDRIPCQQPMHENGDGSAVAFQKKMYLFRHQGPPMAGHFRFPGDPGNALKKILPVLLIPEN
jgi:hypothetical protein